MASRPGVDEKRERLSDPEIRRWFENVARGSQITADNYLRSLFNFSARTGLTPAQIVKLDGKAVHRRLLDFVSGEERRGMAGSTIVTYVKAVRSWLAHHGKKVNRPVKIRGAGRSPTLDDERVPTPDELRDILLAATPQQRVAVALMAFSGVRPEVLGNYSGKDGLRVGDLHELRIERGKVSFETLPTLVRVRETLSKTGAPYFTFLGGEGARYIAEYLEQRLRDGEELDPATDIIHPGWAAKAFIRSTKVSEAVKRAIVKAGFSWRPYVLRHYFDTQLLTAESKGKVAHDFRVYWMGHTGSIDARYTTNKRQLPKAFIEEMRTAYKRCEPFLSTIPTKDATDQVASTRELLLRFAQVPEAEIAKLDLGGMTNDEILAVAEKAQSASRPRRGLGGQKAVPVANVRSMLDDGWEYVAPLGLDQAVLRGPASVPAPRSQDRGVPGPTSI
ncbi:MAG: site-specific integrase [Thermoplasmata archaeon]|nr:site-specific integrase [Thermoplasmata archaeon]